MRRTSADIRVDNRCEVLRQIIASGTVSRQEISVDTGLSPATVTTIVKELLACGVVTEQGFQSSGGGRPRGLVAADTAGGVLVGAAVADSSVRVAVYDFSLTLRAEGEDQGPGDLVDRIDRAVRSVLRETDRVAGAGVSVPVRLAADAAVLTDRLGLPVVVDDPLHAGTMAELWSGAGRDFRDVVVLNLGTEVGAGLALDGRLHRGANNHAGAWGHTRLIADGRLCRCGRRGCVEAYAGAPGIERSLRERTGDPDVSVPGLAAGLQAGDPVAVEVCAELAGHLGVAVADLINLLNPDRVVLGGWVAGLLGEELLPDIRATVLQHALSRPLEVAEITLCRIPGDPAALGAAVLALEHFLSTQPPAG